jgi:hypothetical protein
VAQAQAHSERLRQRMRGPQHTVAGSLVRYPGDTRVDGSLLLWSHAMHLIVLDELGRLPAG